MDTGLHRVSARFRFMSKPVVANRHLSYWEGNTRFTSTTSEENRHARTPNCPRCATISRDQARPGGRAGRVPGPCTRLGGCRFQTPVACTRPLLVLVKETPRFSYPSRKSHRQSFSGVSGCRHTCSVPCHHRDGDREGLRTATVASGVFLSRSLFGDYFLIERESPSGFPDAEDLVSRCLPQGQVLSPRFLVECGR